MKINNDKYYTPIVLANKCWDKVIDNIGLKNITEVIEPSCGNGSFFHYKKRNVDFGYDIEPEIIGDNILTQDYLKANISYKTGRLIIGNPPYGSRMNLVQKFFKKSVEICDYIAFILPISQLNNTQSLYEFDLKYSEDLGEQIYTDRKLHCCFNIYKRPQNGLNKKSVNKLDILKIKRNDSKGYEEFPYDIRMCAWGDGTAGKILNDNEHYSAEYKLLFKDTYEKKNEIILFLKNFDWKNYLKCIAMRKIQQFHIIDVIKSNFNL